MTDIKIGDMVLGGDTLDSLSYATPRKLVAIMSDGQFVLEYLSTETEEYIPLRYKYVRSLDEHKPFTVDTFPKGMVWTRKKGGTTRHFVSRVEESCVFFWGMGHNYQDVLDNHEISTDGGYNWVVAGEEV